MRTSAGVGWIAAFCFLAFLITQAAGASQGENSSGAAPASRAKKRVVFLVEIPVDASSKPEPEDRWFGSLVEQLLHFRMEASDSFGVVPSHVVRSKTGPGGLSDRASQAFVERFGITHTLRHSYELGRDGKTVMYYAELLSTTNKDDFVTFEREFPLDDISARMDECVAWLFKATGFTYGKGRLSRFYSIPVLLPAAKNIRIVGQAVYEAVNAPEKSAEAAAGALMAIVEADSRNLLPHYVAIKILHQLGKHEETALLIKDLFVIIPNYAPLYVDICRHFRLSGRYDDAVAFAAEAEKRKIRTKELMLEGALSLEAMRRYRSASRVFKNILARDSLDSHALVYFARQSNREGRPTDALELAERILSRGKDNGPALLEKGRALYSLEKYHDAMTVLTKSLTLLDSISPALGLAAEVSVLTGNFSKGGDYYNRLIKAGPCPLRIYLRAGEAWQKAGDSKKALAAVSRAEEAFADSAALHRMIGTLSLQSGDTARAAKHLETYLSKGRQDAEIYMTLGHVYTDAANFDRAFYMYNHAMPLLSDKIECTFSLAHFYLRKGDLSPAISYFQDVLAKQPTYPKAHHYLADAWYANGNNAKALEHYSKARTDEENDPHIQARIAAIQFALGNYQETLTENLALVRAGRADANTYLRLATAYLHLKNVTTADKYLRKALKSGKPDGNSWYLLGTGYDKAGQRLKAIDAYEKTLDSTPLHEDALLRLSAAYVDTDNPRTRAECELKLFEVNNEKYQKSLAEAGKLYEEMKDKEKARGLYRQFITRGYVAPEVNMRLARIEYGDKKHAVVIKLLKGVPEAQIKTKADLRMLAVSYYSTNAFSEAIPWLKKLSAKDPRDIETLTRLATSHKKLGNTDSAIRTLESILTVASGKVKADCAFEIAGLHEKTGATAKALVRYRRSIAEFPHDLRNYDKLISHYTSAENWRDTRIALEKVLKLPGTKPLYVKTLAEVCLRLDDKASAARYYDRYLDAVPDDFDAWYILGGLYYDRGDFQKTVELLGKAAGLQPNHFDNSYKLGVSLHNTNKIPEAAKALQRACRLDSTSADALTYLAQCYRTLGENDKLASALARLARLLPADAAVHAELGHVLLGLDRVDAALAALECACKLDQNNIQIRLKLAEIYEQQNNSNAQFSHLKKAYAANPNSADVNYSLGHFHSTQKQTRKAEEHLDRAISIRPGHSQARYELSRLLLAKGKTQAAFEQIEQAVGKDPYVQHSLVLYARIARQLDKQDLALETITRALDIDSTNIDALSLAGILYRESDRFQLAKKFFFRAISVSEKCSECYGHLAEIAFGECDYAKAAGFFRRALQTRDYDEGLTVQLGRTLLLSSQLQAAQDLFAGVYAKNPEHHEAYYRLVHLHLHFGQLDKANALMATRRGSKKTIWEHLAVGEMHEAKGNVEAAFISFTVALRLNPNMSEAHAGCGRIDLAREKYNSAIVNFSKALAKDPYNPYLLLDLGKAFDGIGETSSAIDTYREVAEKYPAIPESYCLLAAMASRKKDHRAAIENVRQGMTHSPDSPKLLFALAEQYRVMDRHDVAIESYLTAARAGGKMELDAYLNIADIYHTKLMNEKEARRFVKKYLKAGGSEDEARKRFDNLDTTLGPDAE